MWKFSDLFNLLTRAGVTDNVHCPDDPTHELFESVHAPSYYRAFLSGGLGEKAERRIGFGVDTRKPELILRTRLECSGTVRAVQLALQHGLAANAAGGTHHAHVDFGSGFTTLNDLVAIVDLDVHQGDGTAAIFADDPDVYTFSMHCGRNFPFRKSASDMDIDLEAGTGDEIYLSKLRAALHHVLDTVQPDLVLYDAGVDVSEHDDLGHLNMSHAGIYQRDRHVVETCVNAGIPIACVIGGGYDRDPFALARRHALVHRAANHVWRKEKMG
jgi:acetoin utilization deacetylase AcuC-like enzyme